MIKKDFFLKLVFLLLTGYIYSTKLIAIQEDTTCVVFGTNISRTVEQNLIEQLPDSVFQNILCSFSLKDMVNYRLVSSYKNYIVNKAIAKKMDFLQRTHQISFYKYNMAVKSDQNKLMSLLKFSKHISRPFLRIKLIYDCYEKGDRVQFSHLFGLGNIKEEENALDNLLLDRKFNNMFTKIKCFAIESERSRLYTKLGNFYQIIQQTGLDQLQELYLINCDIYSHKLEKVLAFLKNLTGLGVIYHHEKPDQFEDIVRTVFNSSFLSQYTTLIVFDPKFSTEIFEKLEKLKTLVIVNSSSQTSNLESLKKLPHIETLLAFSPNKILLRKGFSPCVELKNLTSEFIYTKNEATIKSIKWNTSTLPDFLFSA